MRRLILAFVSVAIMGAALVGCRVSGEVDPDSQAPVIDAR